MAVIQIGTGTADFDTRDPVTFPSVTVRADESYLFFLESTPVDLDEEGSYVTIEAVYSTDTGEVRSPLIEKFFFVGRAMVFKVAVLRLNNDKDQEVKIRLRPKEFYRGSGATRQIPVVLLYEDNDSYNLDIDYP